MASSGAQLAPISPGVRAAGAIRWTREDVARMSAAGLLPQKYELLDGEIISKMAQGLKHRRAVMILLHWLVQTWGLDWVQTQASIDVAAPDNPLNEPEPDLTALNRPLSTFSSNPGPEDIDLLIEVSDSTLSDDLSRKALIYARAGYPEYWIYDIQNRLLHVHRTPLNGTYRSITIHAATAEVAPLARPSNAIVVGNILPETQDS